MANWPQEAQVSVLRGVNSGLSPALIGREQVWRAVNCSIRGGRLRTRSKWVRRKVLYAGLPQGAQFFTHANHIVLSLGGHIVTVDPRDWSMDLLTHELNRNGSSNPYAWMCETEGAMVIQDGRSWALVWDGSDLVRYDREDGYTLPLGTAMAYGNGRLCVATNGSRELTIGDIHTTLKTELGFTETGYLSGGGRITFGSPIKALTHMPIADTSTGKGPLLVGLRKQLHAVRTDITARDTWQTTNGFVTQVFREHGITGAFAHAQVNQDVYFRALDGIRSLRQTVADYQSSGFTPISREVDYRTGRDTEWMLDGCSAAVFDNRLLMTHSPKLLDGIRPIHGGVVALNFDLLSEMGAKTNPAFDGEWSGPDVVQLIPADVDDEPRMFALCREGDANTIWEFMPERTRKVDTVGGTQPVNNPRPFVETRVFYGDDPRTLKELMRVDLWFEKINGYCSFTVKFRAEGTTDWTTIDTFEFEPDAPSFLSPTSEEMRGPYHTIKPPASIDTKRGRPLNLANGFQFRFEWCGDIGIGIWNPNMEARPNLQSAQNPPASAADGSACDTELPDDPTPVAVEPILAVYNEDGSQEITDTLDFGDVHIGDTETVVLQLVNAGGGILVLGTINVTGTGYSIVAGPTLTSIEPGQISYLTLEMTPEPDEAPPT